MNELDEMVKRGKAIGYDPKTLDFAVGYMREGLRTLYLLADRNTDPSKQAREANWIFAHNSYLNIILWSDDFGGALARAERARSGKIVFNGQEYCFSDPT
jgi:hypothetical protein